MLMFVCESSMLRSVLIKDSVVHRMQYHFNILKYCSFFDTKILIEANITVKPHMNAKTYAYWIF